MWMGYENSLTYYMNCCITEWINRGFKNNMKIIEIDNIINPNWVGDDRLHSSHRSNLLRKNFKFYSQYNWHEKNIDYNHIPYWWGEEYGYGEVI